MSQSLVPGEEPGVPDITTSDLAGHDLTAADLAGPPDAAFDLSMAVSQLAANTTDLHLMLKLLVQQLADALGNRLAVERAGRFRKSEQIKSVRIVLGDDTLEATVDGPSVRCTIGHSSGGIRIRSEQVAMDVWLTRLLSTLQAEAQTSEQTRLALEHMVIGGAGGTAS